MAHPPRQGILVSLRTITFYQVPPEGEARPPKWPRILPISTLPHWSRTVGGSSKPTLGEMPKQGALHRRKCNVNQSSDALSEINASSFTALLTAAGKNPFHLAMDAEFRRGATTAAAVPTKANFMQTEEPEQCIQVGPCRLGRASQQR